MLRKMLMILLVLRKRFQIKSLLSKKKLLKSNNSNQSQQWMKTN